MPAEQGDASAQFSLGEMYEIGSDFFEGVPQDYKEAVKWYREAAEQGYASAQLRLDAKCDCDERDYNGKMSPKLQ